MIILGENNPNGGMKCVDGMEKGMASEATDEEK
jgi:hypothetical protein